MTVRVLELFCGLGGCAQALREDDVEVVGAIDLGSHVLESYRLNYPKHPVKQANLQFMTAKALEAYEAQLWWLSPPCQPYTVRGLRKDLEDHRAASLVHLLDVIEAVQPPSLAMENVAGFVDSQAHERLMATLSRSGYHVRERLLCPTQLGIPAQRERYYLVASQQELAPEQPWVGSWRPLEGFLDDPQQVDEALWLDPDDVARHGPGMRILSTPLEPKTRTNCFTSAYAKTFRCAGSFLQDEQGRVRYFSPPELLRLLGFEQAYTLPSSFTLRQCYKYIGNSLSTFAVREILTALPALSARPRWL